MKNRHRFVVITPREINALGEPTVVSGGFHPSADF